jgi:hypothetical protein
MRYLYEEHIYKIIFTEDSLITNRKGQTNIDLIQKLYNHYGIKVVESDIK